MAGRRGTGAAARAAAIGWAGVALRPGPDLAHLLRGWPERLRAALRTEAENRRLFPWLAVAFGVGIVLAFAADGPVSPWPPLIVGAAASGLAAWTRATLARSAVFLGIAATAFGFSAALVRVRTVAAPVLARIAVGTATGFVEQIEERGRGGRIVLRLASLAGLGEDARPLRARVSLRALGGIAPGDFISASVRLLPPPEPARPGGYDFARDAFFRGIGAVGSVSGRLARIDPPPEPAGLALRAAALVDAARNALTARIATTIGGPAGAVSAALVTGKRGFIDEPTNDVLRAAGIYHVVSISGLHMVLAAGVFFAGARALLALSPALALGWPIKKIAALVGMAGATAYCVFSGSDVATERSLLMILVMQGAILVDRPALSFRNLAISALLVLAREPEALLGPSFQMSYAAVAGLIALAELSRRFRPATEGGDPIRRLALRAGSILFGTVATTVVATLATGPFGTYHFQNLQPYGVIGNAATLPLVSFAVMPAAVLGVLAYPFGLDGPIWTVMGWATAGVLRLSEWVASFPHSVVIVPAFGTGALLCLVAALLAGTLFSTRLRLLALAPALIGLWLAGSPVRPDVFVARDGSGVAVRGPDGRLSVAGRVAGFTIEQWLRADGDSRRATDPTLRQLARCDPIGCTVATPDGRVVSVLGDRRGFAQDCRRAAVVVSRWPAPSGCAAATILDRDALAARGAVTLVASASGFVVNSARHPGELSAWRPPPASAQRVRPPSPPPREPAPVPEPAPDDGLVPDPDIDPTP